MKTKEELKTIVFEEFAKIGDEGLFPNHTDKDIWTNGFNAGYNYASSEKHLPDFQRVDWVRMRDCFEKVSNGYISCHLSNAVNEYNSTLPPALKSLPKEMPDGFMSGYDSLERSSWWEWLHSKYGTPELKPSLPTVEELRMDIINTWGKPDVTSIAELAQYIADKYALHPREWLPDLKKGDKFVFEGKVLESDGKIYLFGKGEGICDIQNCKKYIYTPPSVQDVIKKHRLTDEEIKIIKES